QPMALHQRRPDTPLGRHLACDHSRRTHSDNHNVVLVSHAGPSSLEPSICRQTRTGRAKYTAPAVPAPVWAPTAGPTTYSMTSSTPSNFAILARRSDAISLAAPCPTPTLSPRPLAIW